ncbi:hypothetical protein [Flavobacterium sp.]|uniref:hypothetical protein n=1 Tax=Flavobacterium sp. TaxID=239 RepID=UPI002633A737|nr:hypothetical protein [Flavobacterium sp.]MDD3004924.1 hypothetical protein [Flavobacterium sp.]
MKKLAQLFMLVSASLLFSCSSDDGGSSTSSDPIVGKWKVISTTENGAPLTIGECEALETSLFKSNGDFIAEDYELENGECVLQNPNEPGVTVNMKWSKVATNSYKVNFYVNGQESPYALTFTTVFSDNNNQVTTTATEEDGDVVVSVMEKI